MAVHHGSLFAGVRTVRLSRMVRPDSPLTVVALRIVAVSACARRVVCVWPNVPAQRVAPSMCERSVCVRDEPTRTRAQAERANVGQRVACMECKQRRVQLSYDDRRMQEYLTGGPSRWPEQELASAASVTLVHCMSHHCDFLTSLL